MLVVNNSGDMFDERRSKKRRVEKKLKDVVADIDKTTDRRQTERRKKDINSTKKK